MNQNFQCMKTTAFKILYNNPHFKVLSSLCALSGHF